MKTYWRLMGYAKPLGKYVIPYSIFTFLHAFFNIFNFLMLIPILNILFGTDAAAEPVTAMPEFSMNLTKYINQSLNYFLYNIYGSGFSVMQVLMFVAIILILASLLSNLFRYLGQRTMEKMKIFTLRRLRNAVYDNVMHLNAGFFGNERKGDIISKITSDVHVVQFCISSTLQAVFRDPFLILFYMVGLVFISWQLTVFSILYLPVVAILIGAIVKKLRRKATRGQQTYADMVSTLDESLTGIKIIKAYNATDYIKGKFHEINRLYSKIMWSMAKRQQLSSPTSEFLGILAMTVMMLYGGSLVIADSLAAPAFITYLAIFSQITRPVRSFTDAFANINQGIAAGERVFDLLDTKSTITDSPYAVELKSFDSEIEFRDVYFSYESKEVISGVSFKVRKGETVALVGQSGGGKSTLADLIPRFYDVRKGQILIDGRDIRDYTMDSLHANMGIVAQETILFNDTIENNIRMGKRDASFEEIAEAAAIANAAGFISQTEDGYQTNIGDRGMKLSGGQRQRLSIARAILKNPPILILDEATSALDTESEKLVQEALNSLLKGRTSVVIAHRLSTIHNADKIIVIERGRIVEEGTHDELMARNGSYRKLVEMQHMG